MSSMSQCLRTSGGIPSGPHALFSVTDFFTDAYSSVVNGWSDMFSPCKTGVMSVPISPSTSGSFPSSSLKWLYHFLMRSSLSFALMIFCLTDFLPVISLIIFQLSLCFDLSSAVSTSLILFSSSSSEMILYVSYNFRLYS